MAHAGVNPGVYRHMACIHAGGLKRLQKLLTKEIVAHSAHHGDIRTQPGALKRLIGSFSAGGHMEGFSVDGLPGTRNLLRCSNHIHHKAAHNQNPWFSMQHSILLHLHRQLPACNGFIIAPAPKRYKRFLIFL